MVASNIGPSNGIKCMILIRKINFNLYTFQRFPSKFISLHFLIQEIVRVQMDHIAMNNTFIIH